jgi:hypothetical protein
LLVQAEQADQAFLAAQVQQILVMRVTIAVFLVLVLLL